MVRNTLRPRRADRCELELRLEVVEVDRAVCLLAALGGLAEVDLVDRVVEVVQ